VGSLEYIEIPKSDDATTVGFKPSGSRGIVLHLSFMGMRLAIELNNEPRLRTEEIGNVRPNVRLPAKPKAGELFAAKQRPELSFALRHIPSKFSGAEFTHVPPSVAARHLPPQGGKGESDS